MFREGRHAEKQAPMGKTHIVFFVDFSSFFREKSTDNLAKSVKTSFVHKHRQKITVGTSSFRKKSIFSEFLGSPRVPRGLSGRPGKLTKSLIFLVHRELRLKTRLGRPRRSPQAPSGYDFASIFGSILHVKNK